MGINKERKRKLASEENKARARARSKARYAANPGKAKAYAWARCMLRDSAEQATFNAHRRQLYLLRKLKGTLKKQVLSKAQLEAVAARRNAKYKAKAADPQWRADINKKAALNRVLRVGFAAKIAYIPKRLRPNSA